MSTYNIKCNFCDKIGRKHNIENHTKHCKDNPNRISYSCKYCDFITDNHCELGGHTRNCEKNPDYYNILSIISSKLSISNRKRTHSEETKKKISEARIKYLQENPDKVPYKLNHSSKESYPEKYFTELFEKEGIVITRYLHIGLYELDFCIPDKRIDIEIDGSQHVYDYKIVESDIKRTKFLEDLGWDIIRINWSEYQKMNFEEKSKYINDLKNYINRLVDTKPTIEYIKRRKGFVLCSCGNEKYNKSKKCINCFKNDLILLPKKELKKKRKKKYSDIEKAKCEICGGECSFNVKRCSNCYHLKSRKVERPPLEILLKDIEELGYVGTGRKYGVSDNAVRKWVK